MIRSPRDPKEDHHRQAQEADIDSDSRRLTLTAAKSPSFVTLASPSRIHGVVNVATDNTYNPSAKAFAKPRSARSPFWLARSPMAKLLARPAGALAL